MISSCFFFSSTVYGAASHVNFFPALYEFIVFMSAVQGVDKCRESPPTGWPPAAYVLLGREDLALSCVAHSKKSVQLETQTNRHSISLSAPYMLHLQPVTVPSTVSDTIATDTSKFDNVDTSDDSSIDGMEHLFNSSTQLRYGRDLRLNEVSCSQLFFANKHECCCSYEH